VSEDLITISVKKYKRLIRDSEMLQCLENAGVDNWDGWGEALSMMDKDEDDE